ncbi:MAG TPA: glucokinase [Phenylobacterium sp.]|jgi:glucokinase|uniref:glucokinase n=1 Tax=Phenylobacterium sp. TaxID=1871053 RepID=UPI002BB3C17D|nr:glucokinase [Phenylobacterium sp.]HXA38225.1 glucokinase [Phenylobacterium sp.]
MKPYYSGLVGDVGGTNARFALIDGEGRVRNLHIYPAAKYASLNEIIADYLERTMGRKHPPRAVIAVAGPVLDGEIEFTNLAWQVSEGELLAQFEFEAVRLINDFAAQALACPILGPDALKPLGPVMRGDADGPMVVLGAGTGFGVAGLARSERGDVEVSTEGGHAAFAPSDDVEVEIWSQFRARHGRVSIERILSGRGLFELYGVLAGLRQAEATLADERAVFEAATKGDRLASDTLDRFCGILGSVAGDLALSFGARGGVFVSGGIAPRMAERLATGDFRARFEDKGRLSPYVRQIPTSLVVHPYPAILGAARELGMMERL